MSEVVVLVERLHGHYSCFTWRAAAENLGSFLFWVSAYLDPCFTNNLPSLIKLRALTCLENLDETPREQHRGEDGTADAMISISTNLDAVAQNKRTVRLSVAISRGSTVVHTIGTIGTVRQRRKDWPGGA